MKRQKHPDQSSVNLVVVKPQAAPSSGDATRAMVPDIAVHFPEAWHQHAGSVRS
jgi:hypothetical protein